MPLSQGKTERAISQNIRTEETVGKKPRKQAIAIALNTARENGAKIPKKDSKSLRSKYTKKK